MDRESIIYGLNKMSDHELINIIIHIAQNQMAELANKDAEITLLQKEIKLLEKNRMGAVKQEKQLERIADALEGINNNLADVAEMLESIGQTWDGCMSHTDRGNFLCITGDVSTY